MIQIKWRMSILSNCRKWTLQELYDSHHLRVDESDTKEYCFFRGIIHVTVILPVLVVVMYFFSYISPFTGQSLKTKKLDILVGRHKLPSMVQINFQHWKSLTDIAGSGRGRHKESNSILNKVFVKWLHFW